MTPASDLQMVANARMLRCFSLRFLVLDNFFSTPYNLLCTQSQFSSEQHQTMAEDTHELISQLQEAQTSDGREDFWDFGSYPERKGDCLLFEKEVLAIQVGKYQKCEKE